MSEKYYDKLREKKVSDSIIEKLQEIKDEEYSDENELKTAVKTKIADFTNQYKTLIVEYAEEPRIYKLTDQSFDNLRDAFRKAVDTLGEA